MPKKKINDTPSLGDINSTTLHLIEARGALPTIKDVENSLTIHLDHLFQDDIDLVKAVFYGQKTQYTAHPMQHMESVKELLFDHIMLYLDTWSKHKGAYAVFFKQAPIHPKLFCLMYAHHAEIIVHALSYKRSSLPPLKITLITPVCVGVFAALLPTWLNDASFDQGPTMAHLDRLLSKIDMIL